MPNQTGHYEYVPTQGWVKTGTDIPTLKRGVYFNKGGVPMYDASARETFQSKEHKRQWLKENKLREGNIITNPDKRWDGPTRNSSKLTWAQKAERVKRREWIRSQGGTEGLLRRLKQGG